jgi:hypothetical protein
MTDAGIKDDTPDVTPSSPPADTLTRASAALLVTDSAVFNNTGTRPTYTPGQSDLRMDLKLSLQGAAAGESVEIESVTVILPEDWIGSTDFVRGGADGGSLGSHAALGEVSTGIDPSGLPTLKFTWNDGLELSPDVSGNAAWMLRYTVAVPQGETGPQSIRVTAVDYTAAPGAIPHFDSPANINNQEDEAFFLEVTDFSTSNQGLPYQPGGQVTLSFTLTAKGTPEEGQDLTALGFYLGGFQNDFLRKCNTAYINLLDTASVRLLPNNVNPWVVAYTADTPSLCDNCPGEITGGTHKIEVVYASPEDLAQLISGSNRIEVDLCISPLATGDLNLYVQPLWRTLGPEGNNCCVPLTLPEAAYSLSLRVEDDDENTGNFGAISIFGADAGIGQYPRPVFAGGEFTKGELGKVVPGGTTHTEPVGGDETRLQLTALPKARYAPDDGPSGAAWVFKEWSGAGALRLPEAMRTLNPIRILPSDVVDPANPQTPAEIVAVFEPAWVMQINKTGPGHLAISPAVGTVNYVAGHEQLGDVRWSGRNTNDQLLTNEHLDDYTMPISRSEERDLLQAAENGETGLPLPEYRIVHGQQQLMEFRAWYLNDEDYQPPNFSFSWGAAPVGTLFLPSGAAPDPSMLGEANASVRRVVFPSNPGGSLQHHVVRADFKRPLHTADWIYNDQLANDGDLIIELAELNRVIAYHNNSSAFSCNLGVDDGYRLGAAGGYACAPHDSDYYPQANWHISLTELLRLIQFHNYGPDGDPDPPNHAQSYHRVGPDQPATEDGYAPGDPPSP